MTKTTTAAELAETLGHEQANRRGESEAAEKRQGVLRAATESRQRLTTTLQSALRRWSAGGVSDKALADTLAEAAAAYHVRQSNAEKVAGVDPSVYHEADRDSAIKKIVLSHWLAAAADSPSYLRGELKRLDARPDISEAVPFVYDLARPELPLHCVQCGELIPPARWGNRFCGQRAPASRPQTLSEWTDTARSACKEANAAQATVAEQPGPDQPGERKRGQEPISKIGETAGLPTLPDWLLTPFLLRRPPLRQRRFTPGVADRMAAGASAPVASSGELASERSRTGGDPSLRPPRHSVRQPGQGKPIRRPPQPLAHAPIRWTPTEDAEISCVPLSSSACLRPFSSPPG